MKTISMIGNSLLNYQAKFESVMKDSTKEEATMLLDSIESQMCEIPYGEEIYSIAYKTFKSIFN
jgi:hypothetical protein